MDDMVHDVFREMAWKIINLRQERGLTQAQLAAKVGFTRSQVGRIEAGHGETTLRNLEVLAQFFEIPMNKLFERTLKVDVEMELRPVSIEKPAKGPGSQYHRKILSENRAKVRRFEVAPKSRRRLRLDKNLRYEILGIEGELRIQTAHDRQLLASSRILSAKGHGDLELLNIHARSAAVLVFAY